MSYKLRCVAVAAIVGSVMCAENVHAAILDPLFRVSKVQGDVTIQKPDGSVVPAQNAHAYPYGSKVIVPAYVASKDKKVEAVKPEVSLTLGFDYKLRLASGTDAVIGSANDAFNFNAQVVELLRGTLFTEFSISVAMTDNPDTDAKTKAGLRAVIVKTPLAEFFDISDRNEIRVKNSEGLYSVGVKVSSTTIKAKGDEFEITSMRRSTEAEFFGDKDYTRITCLNGQLDINVERGVENDVKVVEKAQMKRRSVAKIWRQYVDVSQRNAISVMILQPAGKVTTYTYLEGEAATGISVSGEDEKEVALPEPGTDTEMGNEFENIDLFGTDTDTSSDENSSVDNDFNFDTWY